MPFLIKCDARVFDSRLMAKFSTIEIASTKSAEFCTSGNKREANAEFSLLNIIGINMIKFCITGDSVKNRCWIPLVCYYMYMEPKQFVEVHWNPCPWLTYSNCLSDLSSLKDATVATKIQIQNTHPPKLQLSLIATQNLYVIKRSDNFNLSLLLTRAFILSP